MENHTIKPGLTLHAMLAIAASQALLYFCLGLAYQNAGHPNEDAFILYIYSESLANTGSISFFEGGPRTEGATDFLWMVLIAGFVKIGINAAVASQLLNTVGVFLAAFLLLTQTLRFPNHHFVFIAAATALPITIFTHAGYIGFSSPLYSSIALLAFMVVGYAPSRWLWSVPLISITLGLLRPDGVILGICFTLVGCMFVSKQHRKSYGIAMAVAAVIGLIYFLWRYQYFGHFLPLPLIVKTEFDGVPQGFNETGIWFYYQFGYILPALAAAIYYFVNGFRRIVIAAVPIIVLTLCIAFTEASQNIFLRFQAPASLLSYFLAATLIAEVLKNSSKTFWRPVGAIFIAVFMFFGAGVSDLLRWKGIITGMSYSSYIDTFPIRLSQVLDKDVKIALTEAGRFAYWIENEKVDLVGLNSANEALNGASPSSLSEYDPGIVFLHTAELVFPKCDQLHFCQFSGPEFSEFIAQSKLPHHADVENRVFRAALASFEFLQQDPDRYTVFVAWHGGGYHHVYYIEKDGTITPETFGQLLDDSFTNPRQWSYVEAYNLFRR